MTKTHRLVMLAVVLVSCLVLNYQQQRMRLAYEPR